MEISTLVSFIALLIFMYVFHRTHQFRKISSINSNHISNTTKPVDLAAELKGNPSLIRFHGISEGDLSEAGINHNELSYLYRDFLIGSIYHLTEDIKNISPFIQKTYRYKLLEYEHTR